jgi:hypothetical protein
VVGIGLLATGLLAGSIQLSNVNTALRREIQELQQGCATREAQRALLSVRWNTASSRQLIMGRAERELGLICPDAPGTILVAARRPASREGWLQGVQLATTAPSLPAAVAATNQP